MKSKFLILSVLLLTACNTSAEPDLEALNNPEESQFSPQSTQERLDVDTVVMAVERQNEEFCDLVENPQQAEQCRVKVQDAVKLKAAVSQTNEELCAEISEQNSQEKCRLMIETEEERMEAKKELNAQYEREAQIMESAQNNSDASLCAQIESPEQSANCRYNVFANLALDQNNPALCEQIADDFLIKLCKERF